MSDADALLPLPWQQSAWNTVAGARQRGQLTHAWLLAGSEGVGKRAFARAFAASLLCAAPAAGGLACGACRACRMLRVGGHPDAHLLNQGGHLGLAASDSLADEDGLSFWTPRKDSAQRDIAVDAARSLLDKLSTVSHLGGARVVVVHPASAMSEATANALLKTIEEPPANTYLLFLAEFPQALKQTIRSRCQLLRFPIPPAAPALEWLQQRRPEADADLLAQAGGAPLRALDWMTTGEPGRRQRWQQLLRQVSGRQIDPIAAAAEFGRDRAEVAALCRYWQEQLRAGLRDGHWGGRHEQFLRLLLDSLRLLEHQNASPQLVLESLLLRWRVLAMPAASA